MIFYNRSRREWVVRCDKCTAHTTVAKAKNSREARRKAGYYLEDKQYICSDCYWRKAMKGMEDMGNFRLYVEAPSGGFTELPRGTNPRTIGLPNIDFKAMVECLPPVDAAAIRQTLDAMKEAKKMVAFNRIQS